MQMEKRPKRFRTTGDTSLLIQGRLRSRSTQNLKTLSFASDTWRRPALTVRRMPASGLISTEMAGIRSLCPSLGPLVIHYVCFCTTDSAIADRSNDNGRQDLVKFLTFQS